MTNSRIVIDSIDADGCVYNTTYHCLLLWLMTEHGATLTALQKMREQAKQQGSENPEIAASVERLISELQALDVAGMTENRYLELAHKFIADTKARISSEKKANPYINTDQLFATEVEHFLTIMQTLDEDLLGAALVRANQPLFDRLQHHDDRYDLQLIALASLRQAHGFDQWGVKQNHTNSIFKDLVYLTRHLRDTMKQSDSRISLNPITLTDLTAGLPVGESFRRVVTETGFKHETYMCDVSKFAILYAQAHDAALKYLNFFSNKNGERVTGSAEITLNFYENEMEIIQGLLDVLNEYPELLPSNVKVVFHPYDGGFFAEPQVRQGTGLIDDDYRNNVRYLISLAQIKHPRARGDYVNVVEEVDMLAFLTSRVLAVPEKTYVVMLDADGCIYNKAYKILLMRLIKKYGADIRKFARDWQGNVEIESFIEKLTAEILDEDVSGFDLQQYQNLITALESSTDLKIWDDDLIAQGASHDAEPYTFILRQYMRFLDEINHDLMSLIICCANQKLFIRIANAAIEKHCRRVVFLVGSNRQSVNSDEFNSIRHGTGRFHHDLERVTRFLNGQFEGKLHVEQDQILLSDLYANLNPGVSYQRALSAVQHEPHAHFVFDETKASQVYSHFHYIAHRYPGVVAMEFYDDRSDILAAIAKAYGENDTHGLLPRGYAMHLIRYNGNIEELQNEYIIRGNGKPDVCLHQSIQLMASMAGVDLQAAKRTQSRMNVAQTLNLKLFLQQREKLKSRAQLEFDSLVDDATEISVPASQLGFFAKAAIPAADSRADVNEATAALHP